MLKDLSISKKLVLSFSLFFMMLLSLGGMSFVTVHPDGIDRKK